MKVASHQLIEDLTERTRNHINAAQDFLQMPTEKLKWRSSEGSWNILECFEHLNRYGDFYLPEIEHRIKTSRHESKRTFKSGWLGNYFAESMLPKQKLNKMKTFNDKNPLGQELSKEAIERFISQQHKTLDLLNKSRKVDLSRTKTAISITKWLKLKLGDTLRVVIYHNSRHLEQARKTANQFEQQLISVK